MCTVKKARSFAHFAKNVFFKDKTTCFEFSVFLDWKEAFAEAKKWFFVISSSRSIKWCEKR
jgi:hypothetical protein